MLVARKIRILVSDHDAKTLEFMQSKSRALYNWWLGKLKSGEKWNFVEAKRSLKASREHDPELNDVYGMLLAEVYFRLDRAMQAFFRRVKKGEKPGFPRFRPRHKFFSLVYPGRYIKLKGNKVILPTGGKGKNKKYHSVRGILTEKPPREYRSVVVSRDASGKYYCSFMYDKEVLGQSNKGGIVAFDLGIKTLAMGVTDSGRDYEIGGFTGYRWFNKQLDKIRSLRSRCKKGSRRYKFLSETYQKVSAKRRNKLKDCLHKASHLIACKLAESAVIVGDLSQREMVSKSDNKKLNRAVYNNWGLYEFITQLKYKCKLSGKDLYLESEKGTSKTCFCCGSQQEMPLYKREYFCTSCGIKINRDANSARNILLRHIARQEPEKLLGAYSVLGVRPRNQVFITT
ncbi:RNA-guided endonuclease InsQ/TnpB family protein [Mastigocoleus testarum]|uniref:Transposase n=1 Tax=Mastigocoleus testarum BC008 TaxID=371196 RepID=A0A0V7ZCM4_9CYAN|nr:RNA-guided endonuclease TnpB family protein [Mastigocoleus testarum]KST62235.1 hypothetical protein BC008_08675 [Mastigocoleus testarum BC008]